MGGRLVWGTVLVAFATARCVSAEPGDEFWDDRFGTPGTDLGGVTAVLHDSGVTYFGGNFSTIGRIAATNVAKWDGTNWSALGAGVNGAVDSLALVQNELYVAGGIYEASGRGVRRIAKWDGNDWSDVGGGVNGEIFSLATDGTNLYAGGHFTEAGGVPASKVAKWDGQTWSALGAGIIPVFEPNAWVGSVGSLAVSGSEVFVGGTFRNAGGIGATNIARWDGTNWHTLGKGLRYYDGPGSENGGVGALAVHSGFLFAGGTFRRAGDVAASNIAQWDGSDWAPLGSGVDDMLSVLALAASGSDLFVGGVFARVGGINASRVAKWDGQKWSPLASGIGGSLGEGVSTLASSGESLFVGGLFPRAGGKPSTNMALWYIPHALSISQTNNQVNLSWPATGTNFVLEAKDDVAGTNWSEVSQPPALHNNECVVTDALNGSSKFYRLRRR